MFVLKVKVCFPQTHSYMYLLSPWRYPFYLCLLENTSKFPIGYIQILQLSGTVTEQTQKIIQILNW